MSVGNYRDASRVITDATGATRYQQCELMTAHYKQPILLIEFDEKKSFNLDVCRSAESDAARP